MTFLGAGDEEAGEAEAGMGEPEVVEPRAVTPIRAVYLHGFARDALIEEDGLYRGAHPIDHRIASSLTLVLGQVPADTRLGSTLLSLPIASEEVMTRDAEIRVREAIGDLLDSGQVNLLSVRAFSPINAPPGRVRIEVRCENLALQKEERVKTFVFEK